MLFSTRRKCLDPTNSLTKRRHSHVLLENNTKTESILKNLHKNNYKISNTLLLCQMTCVCLSNWTLVCISTGNSHTQHVTFRHYCFAFAHTDIHAYTHRNYYQVIQSVQMQWKTVHSTHKRSIIQYSVVLQKWSQNSWVSETLLSSSITGLFIFPKKTSSFHFFTVMKYIIDCIFKKKKVKLLEKNIPTEFLKLFKGREGFTYKIKATFM